MWDFFYFASDCNTQAIMEWSPKIYNDWIVFHVYVVENKKTLRLNAQDLDVDICLEMNLLSVLCQVHS